MSQRGDDRPYKVVYSTRRRGDFDDSATSRRQKRDIEYEDDYRRERAYARDYRDDHADSDRQSRVSDSRTSLKDSAITKTRYSVGRDRNAESYVKRSNAVTIEDRPAGNGRYDYEVLRPQRNDDGAYVVDLGGRQRDYAIDTDPRNYGRSQRTRYDDEAPPRRDDAIMYDRGGRDRELSYRNVQVMEDIDDRYSRRGRETEDDIPPRQRPRSAIRDTNASPPPLRRKASVGFYRDQISQHDASESRHERPGAEAHVAGRYLSGNGQSDDDLYVAGYTRRDRSRSRSKGRYGPQRSDPRLREYDEIDDERRTFTEATMRDYEYEDHERPAYPPQRSQSRRRYQDDDRYSQYDTDTYRKTTKEYYR